MRNIKSGLISLIGIITICTTPIFSDASANDETTTSTPKYSSDCELHTAFTNAETMAQTMADPAKFMELMTLMAKPEFIQSQMNCSADPQQWTKWMNNAVHPQPKFNAANVFMQPQMYMNWMTAMMNPQFYQTAMTTYMNPALYSQWMSAMTNPAYYQAMMNIMNMQNAQAWVFNPTSYQAAQD